MSRQACCRRPPWLLWGWALTDCWALQVRVHGRPLHTRRQLQGDQPRGRLQLWQAHPHRDPGHRCATLFPPLQRQAWRMPPETGMSHASAPAAAKITCASALKCCLGCAPSALSTAAADLCRLHMIATYVMTFAFVASARCTEVQ